MVTFLSRTGIFRVLFSFRSPAILTEVFVVILIPFMQIIRYYLQIGHYRFLVQRVR